MSQPPDISPIIDRRPIATRERRFAQAIAHRMARAGINPNSISVSGMLFGIAAGAALSFADASSLSGRLLFFLGALLIQLRLLANLFDGMVAIERGVASPVGELYNEVPDRVSDTFILIGFGYAAASNPVLGYWAAVLALFTAYVRAEGRVAGAPACPQRPRVAAGSVRQWDCWPSCTQSFWIPRRRSIIRQRS